VRVLGTIVLVGMLAIGSAGIYVVQPGDTLTGIAARTGASVAAIAGANGLRDADRILVGQHLTIPDAGDPGAAPGTYVVRRGDTLGAIAARTGVPVTTIVAANGLVGPTLYAGVRLRLVPLTGPTGNVLYGPEGRGVGVHVVRAGETLDAIARRSGSSVAALVQANGIRDADLIRIGQRLTVPGGWVCPVQGRLRFVNDWGFPREGGRAHEGTDLFADRGTPVVAPVNGVAEQVAGQRAGRQVTVRGDDGFVYINAHLNSFGAAGRVRAGDVLGTVGTSGNAAGTPAHLHFEIHPGGIGPVNPYPTLRGVSC
jgi:murein DD-endopeptidase MepM/ murein hydrolase activator NlpD